MSYIDAFAVAVPTENKAFTLSTPNSLAIFLKSMVRLKYLKLGVTMSLKGKSRLSRWLLKPKKMKPWCFPLHFGLQKKYVILLGKR